MPDIKIIYIAGYGLKKNNGRNKATWEKAAALQNILGERNFRLYAPAAPENKLARYLCMLFLDFYLLPRMLLIDKRTFVIERQAFLPLTNTFLRLRGVRIICEVHADPMGEIPFLQKSRAEKLVLRLLALFEWYNWRLASAMIYINPLFRKQMDARVRKPSISVYNGCDPDTFIIMDMQACRKKLGLDARAKYFLMIGAIARWRGVDLLIDIFKQEPLRNHHLLIVGMSEDDYSRQIFARGTGQANISFRDYMDISTSVEYINAADVCLVPVNDILSAPGSPLKLYDYIACGKPVVTQKGVLGYSDEVERYHLGIVTDFMYPPAAAGDLASFIDTGDLNFYCINNRRIAKEKVSWEKRMKEWKEFMQNKM